MVGALSRPRQARSWRTKYYLSASAARLQQDYRGMRGKIDRIYKIYRMSFLGDFHCFWVEDRVW